MKTNPNQEVTNRVERQNWHQMESEEVLSALESSQEGLSATEAAERLDRYGPNSLQIEKGFKPLDILIRLNTDPIVYVLFGAAALAAILGEYIDAGVIFAVVVINTIIGFFQEFKAEQSLQALRKLTAPRARVYRDGEQRDVPATEVVPGDAVYLESGMKVPADLRLFRTIDLEIDESILTGESQAAAKTVAPVPDPHASLGDQDDMAFMSTTVVRGRGYGVVVATGMETAFGTISKQVQEVQEAKTPLQRNLASLAKVIAAGVVLLSVLVAALGLWAGEDLVHILLTAVATAAAVIPEGLPVTVTAAMAVGVRRMAGRNAIIRKLPAVETLGSCTVICSDKTGTLTKNEMTVTRIWTGGKTYSVSGVGYAPSGEIQLDGRKVPGFEDTALEMTLRTGLLANEGSIYEEDGRYLAGGDPTDAALITAAHKGGLKPEAEYEKYPELDIMPFESERRFMAVLVGREDERLVLVKGAPERVLEMCIAEPGQDGPFNREAAQQANKDLAAQGLRVLAMAYKPVPPGSKELDDIRFSDSMVFAGLEAMIDPPRPETKDAVAKAKRAGIRVVMITGDQRITAQAIARQVGIIPDRQADDPACTIIEGRELATMTDEELYRRVEDVSVYARANPEHKLRIVRQLKAHGEVVALTGDGVNDAPALKAADIGISMGQTGTDVAKEASDMVLADDNFATIFAAVEEGRVVFDNIRRVVMFLLPTDLGLVMTIIATIIIGLPLPFLPAQIIWINLVTNGLQDVAMAFEPAEKDVGTRRPRDPKGGIVNRLMIRWTIIVGLVVVAGTIGIYWWQLEGGATETHARTVALTAMVLFQSFHILNSRSFSRSFLQMNPFSNPILFVSAAGALGLHVLALYLPPLQFVLRTEPIPLETWAALIVIATSVVFVIEIEKLIRRMMRGRTEPG